MKYKNETKENNIGYNNKSNYNNLNKKQKNFKSQFNKTISEGGISIDTIYNSESPTSLNFYKRKKNKSKDPYDAENIKEKMILLRNQAKVNKIKINLIFFYENMTKENNNLYNRLKLVIEGAFFGVQNKDVLQELLLKIEKVDSSFILISTGSSFKKISNICARFLCIKHILIYCFDVNNYKTLFGSQDKINLISGNINEVNHFLLSKSQEENYDKNLKYFINYNPLFSFYEYKNYYYIYLSQNAIFFLQRRFFRFAISRKLHEKDVKFYRDKYKVYKI